jgi:flavorubredoxin
MCIMDRRTILLGLGASLLSDCAMVKASASLPSTGRITREDLERMNAEFLEWVARITKHLEEIGFE